MNQKFFISPLAYWGDAPNSVGAGRNLTFELDAASSWSFPRAHLIRFEVTTEECINPWVINSDKKLSSILRFVFQTRTMMVQTNYPRELLAAILAGDISVLVRGNPGRKGELDDILSEQTEPPFTSASTQRYVYTGTIKPEPNHE